MKNNDFEKKFIFEKAYLFKKSHDKISEFKAGSGATWVNVNFVTDPVDNVENNLK